MGDSFVIRFGPEWSERTLFQLIPVFLGLGCARVDFIRFKFFYLKIFEYVVSVPMDPVDGGLAD